MDQRQQEKSERILDLVPRLFSNGGYLEEQTILGGGTALNLHFSSPRPSTDIDIQEWNPQGLTFRERFDHIADELRAIAQREGYEFRIHVQKSPQASLFYEGKEGTKEKITIDCYMPADPTHALEPVAFNSERVGDIRILRFEEMLGSKLSMLSLPRLRGKKRYGDLHDAYQSITYDADHELLKKMFVYAMTRLEITISSDKMQRMLDWYQPERFSEKSENATEIYLPFSTLRNGILSAYRNLCDLNPVEKVYNRKKIPGNVVEPVAYLLEDKTELMAQHFKK